MIDKFNDITTKQILDALETALEKLDIPGVRLVYGGGSFNERRFNLRLEAVLIGAEKKALARVQFEALAREVGLTPDDYGREFQRPNDDKRYRVVGVDFTRGRHPIVVEDVATGKRYGFPEMAALYIRSAQQGGE